ncbi:Transcriptional activator of glycolytic enzymes domain containing protein [Elaphomyces granulatus]
MIPPHIPPVLTSVLPAEVYGARCVGGHRFIDTPVYRELAGRAEVGVQLDGLHEQQASDLAPIQPPNLWDEWTVEIEGKPAVQDLDRSYGPAWRPSASERVLFSRRKVIIDEIQARIKSGLSP